MYHDFSVLTLMEGEQGYPLKLEPLIGDLRQAVLFSGGGLLVFLHLFLQPPSLKDNTAHRVPSYRRLLVLIAALIGSGFLFAVASGCDWDYSVYLKMWGTVLHGENPWRTQSLTEHERNAYGPLFNLLAPTIRVGNFFPKLLFCSSTWAFGVFLLALTFRERAPAPKVVGVALLVFLCPFLWIQILRRGEFDIIPGLLTVAAIHFRVRQRDMLSGLALASAFLFKYYPIAILPFLMLDGQRVRLRLGLVAILGSALGLSLSYLYWGGATFDSLLLASSRPSRHYSIFAFLQSKLSPLRALTGRNNFDQFSLPAMAVAGCLALILCHVRRVPPVPAALIGMLTILMFYKVGYAQYFTVLFLIALYWYAIGQPDWIWEPPVSIVLWSYFVWLQVRLVPIWFLTSYILLGCFCLASAARDRLPGVSGRGAMIVPLASISTLFASQLFMFIVESTGYPADFLGLPLFVLGALMILEIFRRSPVAATA
jgi:hypothetical protein